MNHNLQQVPATAGSNNAVAFTQFGANEPHQGAATRQNATQASLVLPAGITRLARKFSALLLGSLEIIARSNPY